MYKVYVRGVRLGFKPQAESSSRLKADYSRHVERGTASAPFSYASATCGAGSVSCINRW
jgi:hypothetical protein